MRALGFLIAACAAGTLLSQAGSARSAGSVQTTTESYCDKTAAKNNHAPTASLKVTPSGVGANANRTVTLTTKATDADGDTLSYVYTLSGGRMRGEGATIVWDLSTVQPGTYTARALVGDGKGCSAYLTTNVTIDR